MANFVKFEIIGNDGDTSDVMVNVDHIIWAYPYKDEGYSKLQMTGGGILKVRGDLAQLNTYSKLDMICG